MQINLQMLQTTGILASQNTGRLFQVNERLQSALRI